MNYIIAYHITTIIIIIIISKMLYHIISYHIILYYIILILYYIICEDARAELEPHFARIFAVLAGPRPPTPEI